jgi:acyl-CoA thioester hydrolase
MAYRFKQEYRVRYDESNLHGVMSPAAVLRYLQDIAVLDAVKAELIGTGDWVARRTIMDFLTSIPVRSKVEIVTYPLGFTKVTALRGYDLLLKEVEADPQLAVRARTLWVYLDTRGKPTRITPDLLEIWVPAGETLPTPPVEAEWPPFNTQPTYTSTATVRFSDLDVMGHMNNTAYVELLDNVAWESLVQTNPHSLKDELVPLHYDIEYMASAQPGDKLLIDTWIEMHPNQPAQFERLQRVQREDGTLLVRARSVWYEQNNQTKT